VAPSDGDSPQPAGGFAAGVVIAAYGFAVYLVFGIGFLYLIGFVLDVDRTIGPLHLVGKSINRGGLGDGTLTVTAVVTDLVLLTLFGVQHSVMARAGFKSWLTRVVPPSAERSTYVLASTIFLLALLVGWFPITQDIWRVTAQPWRALLTATPYVGWAIVLLSTFLIDHFDLFGVRQVLARLRGRPLPDYKFTTPLLYKVVRHPLYLGFLIAFWGTPRMTLGHLIFATAMTGYILIAVRFEERDLIHMFKDAYIDYRRRVPMLIPGWGGRL
jgi:methanethiol S-methyltransferase